MPSDASLAAATFTAAASERHSLDVLTQSKILAPGWRGIGTLTAAANPTCYIATTHVSVGTNQPKEIGARMHSRWRVLQTPDRTGRSRRKKLAFARRQSAIRWVRARERREPRQLAGQLL
jgi:hypothetical protein